MEKIACFSGHRHIEESEYDSVYKATLSYVRELIYEDYTIFRCGGALGFDMMAADIVLSLKEEFPDIKLHTNRIAPTATAPAAYPTTLNLPKSFAKKSAEPRNVNAST